MRYEIGVSDSLTIEIHVFWMATDNHIEMHLYFIILCL